MSQVLYAVRLHPSFRFWQPPYQLNYDDRSVMRRFPEVAGLFPTRARAVEYAATTLPLEANPFAVNWWTFYPGEEVLTLSLYDPYWLSNSFYAEWDVAEFSRSVQERGFPFLKPAEWDIPLAWQLWWEEITRSQSEDQKQSLRKELQLPNWRPNPFDTETIALEWQDSWLLFFDNKHEVLKEELVGLAALFSTPLPEFGAATEQYRGGELALFSWWEESACKLPADSREQLWRLLCPYPWEIVEVPLT